MNFLISIMRVNKCVIFTILLCIVSLHFKSFSQTSKGISVVSPNNEVDTKYRMLVIGISNYKNIPSLQFAHKDAQLFYDYMRKAYKDKLNDKNTKLLLNEEATASNIFSQGFDWLIQESEPGETIIIYFSGHGDVENSTMNKHGFLLAYDSPRSVYMAGGTIAVDFLQSYIQTLVEKKNAKIILIADACRSGKLAGGASGATTTSAALQQQWENVIKIMSSQPGEVSFEGQQWNSGGGVFTYYLVKGMLGQSDRNKDSKVSIYELDNYLYENVSTDTKNSQTPTILGNKSDIFAFVNSDLVAYFNFLDNNSEKNGELAMTNSRGMEDEIKNPLLKEKYTKFNQCIVDGLLVQSDSLSKDSVAYDYFLEISRLDNEGFWTRNSKRKLVGALQNKYITFINRIIEDGKISSLFNNSSEKQIVENEISLAYKLMDVDFPNYKSVLTAYTILSAFNSEFETKQLGYLSYMPIIDSCISLSPQNSLLYYIKGKLFGLINNLDSANIYFDYAILYSPTFVSPLISKSEIEFSKNKFESVINCLNSAKIENKSIGSYQRWHKLYIKSLMKLNKQSELKNFMDTIEVKNDKNQLTSNRLIGFASFFKWYRTEIDSSKKDSYLFKENELLFLAKKKEFDLNNTFLNLNKPNTIDSLNSKVIFYNLLIDYYFDQNQDSSKYYYSKLIDTQNIICKLDPSVVNYLDLLGSYIGVKNIDESINVLEKMINLGFKNFDILENSDGTENLINDKRYKKIKKKAFLK